MHSMTGYGRARREAEGRCLTVELKSVNHRFLDVALRMPRSLSFLEDPVRRALGERLSRGHVDVFLAYQNSREDARRVTVNAALARAYAQGLDELAALIGARDERTVAELAALPDVMTVAEADEDQEAVTAMCNAALSDALRALETMRENEGNALARDVLARLDALEAIARGIAARAPGVVRDYQAKLEARIAELLAAPPDPQRLAQEVAFMADRAAIDEELVRLESHIAQMRQMTREDGPVGRKLDFLVQELNREVNTIGSKASDLQIATAVVEAKAEIEKLREQVQNVE